MKHEYDVEENFVMEEITTKETQGSRFSDLFFADTSLILYPEV